jgi:hypothetical protein
MSREGRTSPSSAQQPSQDPHTQYPHQHFADYPHSRLTQGASGLSFAGQHRRVITYDLDGSEYPILTGGKRAHTPKDETGHETKRQRIKTEATVVPKSERDIAPVTDEHDFTPAPKNKRDNASVPMNEHHVASVTDKQEITLVHENEEATALVTKKEQIIHGLESVDKRHEKIYVISSSSSPHPEQHGRKLRSARSVLRSRASL